jgi:hypothetical protein
VTDQSDCAVVYVMSRGKNSFLADQTHQYWAKVYFQSVGCLFSVCVGDHVTSL